MDLCHNTSFQLSQIYDQIINGFTVLAGKNDNKCCAAVVKAIGDITGQLSIIAAAVTSISGPGTPIDLGPIVTALGELVAAVGAIGTGPAVDLGPLVDAVNMVAATIERTPDDTAPEVKRLADANDTANALGKSLVSQWATLIPGDPGTTQLILS